jgi:hypothetical protein
MLLIVKYFSVIHAALEYFDKNNKSGSTMCQPTPCMGQVGTRAEVRKVHFSWISY